MSFSGRRGVYPGSFDPLTVAHVAVAEAAKRAADLDRVDFAMSRVALGKENRVTTPIAARVAAIGRVAEQRQWIGVVVTEAQLLHDIAYGYDVLVMGADKWRQVHDPRWYGGSTAERDAAVAALPRVLVAPRPGFAVEDADMLDVDPAFADVSSTAARNGAHHLIVPEARRRLIVDGSNVIGTRPDGWWNDRDAAARRLVEALQRLSRRTGSRIAVVLDGKALADVPEGVHAGVLVAYAQRRGRNAADDRIVEEVAADADPASLTIVTSDRELIRRVQALGAQVERPTSFIRELESVRD